MIAGLRLFAWVQWRRGWDADRAADEGYENVTAEKFADCDWCMERTSETTRRTWHCGFIPRARWIHPDQDAELSVRLPPGRDLRTNVCPGYLIQRPEVIEAARALAWSKRGQLEAFYRGAELTDTAVEAIEIVAGEQNQTQAYGVREAMRVARAKAKAPQ